MKKLLWGFWKFNRHTEAPPKRRVHLGIDFGTSTSKIVFRDYGAPGGERVVLVLHDDCPRIPSRVCLTPKDLLFGSDGKMSADCEVYESIKMHAAAEVTGIRNYYFGPPRSFPTKGGFSAADLATLAIWYLISEGNRAVSNYLGEDVVFNLGMTMGVPMAFFNDEKLRLFFLPIVRRAWYLFREQGPIGSTLAIEKASRCLSASSGASLVTVPDNQVRDWIRSEGEAAMWGPFQSPAIAAGPYAKIDIGAGTSHSSLFRIFGDSQIAKKGIAFLGAATVPAGMDAVDRAIADSLGLECDFLALRGREESILQRECKARRAVGAVRDQIYDAYRRAWIQTFQKIKGSIAEIAAWRDHKIFTIGGGSLVPTVIDRMRLHPSGGNNHLKAASLEPPPDLVRADRRGIQEDELRFIMVAYGLSNIGLSIPEASAPYENPPLPDPSERRIRLDRDDIYAK